MDFIFIIAQVWSTLPWIFLAALLVGLPKSPWGREHIGELLVSLFSHRRLDIRTYRRLHNVTLNTLNGAVKIDNVFLCPTAMTLPSSR